MHFVALACRGRQSIYVCTQPIPSQTDNKSLTIENGYYAGGYEMVKFNRNTHVSKYALKCKKCLVPLTSSNGADLLE